MADVPHFRTPFRFAGGRASVVEQDTVDEVAQCVEVLLMTETGARAEAPEFGTPQALFQQAPIDVERIANAVSRFEPRANAVASERPDQYDAMIRYAEVRVGGTDNG